MSADESAAPVPLVWRGIDLSRLPRHLAESLSRFMAETDAIRATGSELDGPQAEVVSSVLAAGISRLTVAKVRALPVVDADGCGQSAGPGPSRCGWPSNTASASMQHAPR